MLGFLESLVGDSCVLRPDIDVERINVTFGAGGGQQDIYME